MAFYHDITVRSKATYAYSLIVGIVDSDDQWPESVPGIKEDVARHRALGGLLVSASRLRLFENHRFPKNADGVIEVGDFPTERILGPLPAGIGYRGLFDRVLAWLDNLYAHPYGPFEFPPEAADAIDSVVGSALWGDMEISGSGSRVVY